MAANRVTTATAESESATAVSFEAFNAVTGNLIVLGLRTSSNATINSVTDTAGNTYTAAGSVLTGDIHTQVWYAKNITGNAANVVTINMTNASGTEAVLHQVSGLDTTSPFDTFTTKKVTPATVINSDAWNVDQKGYIFSFVTNSAVSSFTADSDYTISGTTTHAAAQFRRNAASITGEVTSITAGSSGDLYLWAVSFKINPMVLATTVSTFTLSGINVAFIFILIMATEVASFAVTGVIALLRFIGWTYSQVKSATSWNENDDKSSTSWTNRSKL